MLTEFYINTLAYIKILIDLVINKAPALSFSTLFSEN